MQGGQACADILLGRVNPSGRLPLTFPVSYDVTPTRENFGGDGIELDYAEGIYVGYRYYDRHPEDVMYPFGHGLSYTEFEYGEVKAELTGEAVEVTLTVKNTGDLDGSETVQIYVSAPQGKLDNFLKANVKKMLIGAVVGAVLACGLWFLAALAPEFRKNRPEEAKKEAKRA